MRSEPLSFSSDNDFLQKPADSCAPIRWDGRFYFEQSVRDAVRAACTERWSEMVWCDPDYADWPLGERQVAQDLRDWSLGGGRLTLLLHSDRILRQRHARFVTWRGDFDHRITCRRLTVRDATTVPSVLWSPQWAMHRLDVEHSRGVCSTQAAWLRQHREALLEWQHHRSAPGFAATTLGL